MEQARRYPGMFQEGFEIKQWEPSHPSSTIDPSLSQVCNRFSVSWLVTVVFEDRETGHCRTHTWAVSKRDRIEAIEIQSIKFEYPLLSRKPSLIHSSSLRMEKDTIVGQSQHRIR